MSEPAIIRHLAVFDSGDAAFRGNYFSEDPTALSQMFAPAVLVDRPTRRWISEENARTGSVPLVVVLGIACDKYQEVLASTSGNGFPRMVPDVAGLDVPVDVFEHWCPGQGANATFSTLDHALAVSGIAAQHAKHRGKGVNIVIVDKGVDFAAARIEAQKGKVWFQKEPGQYTTGEPPSLSDEEAAHGTMIARLVHAAAPEATIHDLRAIRAWSGQSCFLSETLAGYLAVLKESVAAGWVFVNAWGMWDTRAENNACEQSIRYSNNPEHPFTQTIAKAGESHHIVFAAGNCGGLCPSGRCGPDDRGPHRSVLGANGSASVTAVGAARTDDLWLGYASEGPSALGQEKPDFCAPSQFRYGNDGFLRFTGTSAAAAITAGGIACLLGASPAMSPDEMRGKLRTNARGKPGGGWDRRLGTGFLDLGGL